MLSRGVSLTGCSQIEKVPFPHKQRCMLGTMCLLLENTPRFSLLKSRSDQSRKIQGEKKCVNSNASSSSA